MNINSGYTNWDWGEPNSGGAEPCVDYYSDFTMHDYWGNDLSNFYCESRIGTRFVALYLWRIHGLWQIPKKSEKIRENRRSVGNDIAK